MQASDADAKLVEIVETDYFGVSADPTEETISIAFFERSLLMDFTYEELLDFADVVERSRAFIEERVRQKNSARG